MEDERIAELRQTAENLGYKPVDVFDVTVSPTEKMIWRKASESIDEYHGAGQLVDQLRVDGDVTNPAYRAIMVYTLTRPNNEYRVVTDIRDIDISSLVDYVSVGGVKSRPIDRIKDEPMALSDIAKGIQYWLSSEGCRLSEPQKKDYIIAIAAMSPYCLGPVMDDLMKQVELMEFWYGSVAEEAYDKVDLLLDEPLLPKRYACDALLGWIRLFDQTINEKELTDEELSEYIINNSEFSRFISSIDSKTETNPIRIYAFNRVVEYLDMISNDDLPYQEGYDAAKIAQYITNPNLRFKFIKQNALDILWGVERGFRPFTIDSKQSLENIQWFAARLDEMAETYPDLVYGRGIEFYKETLDLLFKDYQNDIDRRKKAEQDKQEALDLLKINISEEEV